jgi:hypothetical protein
MKDFLKLSALAAVFVASATLASAESIQIGSYSTTGVQGTNANTSLTFSPTTPAGITPYTGGAFGGFTTQNDGFSGPTTVTLNNVTPTWTAAQAGSEWVSFGQTGPNTPAGSQPGGHFAPNGNYYFQSTFAAPVGPLVGGFLNIMADDTVVVFLNGHEENIPTDPGAYGHCSEGAPSCFTPTLVTFNSADFVLGSNTLTFQLVQGGSYDTGLDFTGTVSAVPEPSTLLMLGTGLIGSAGALFRRMRS